MNNSGRELCPNCLDFTDAVEEVRTVRENMKFTVERVTLHCPSCNRELADTVTLKFKHTAV